MWTPGSAQLLNTMESLMDTILTCRLMDNKAWRPMKMSKDWPPILLLDGFDYQICLGRNKETSRCWTSNPGLSDAQSTIRSKSFAQVIQLATWQWVLMSVRTTGTYLCWDRGKSKHWLKSKSSSFQLTPSQTTKQVLSSHTMSKIFPSQPSISELTTMKDPVGLWEA